MITRTRCRRAVSAMLAAVLAAVLLHPAAAADADEQPSPGEAYAAMGFGVFLHYGLATFVGQTPWSYDPDDVAATVYDPPDFDPDQWMDAIAASGAKYVILTTKHHDGFTMWPSAYTDYGVQSSSDPDTDVVGEVVRAARERGLKVAFYYSWFDKLHPGGEVIRRNPIRWFHPSDEYVEYAQNHLRELLTNYGHVEAVYLDVPVYAREAGISEFIHSVSPETAFIWKDSHGGRKAGEYEDADVRSWEGGRIPCQYMGDPPELAMNISAGPGWWQFSDEAPPKQDAAWVESVMSETQNLGGTLSLNVSPGPSGRIPPASVQLLETLGDRQRGDDLAFGASAAAGDETSGHPAGHATDLLAKTHWQVPADEDSAWLQVDLPEPMTINRTAVQLTTADAASSYEIEYLDADGTWHNAHSGGRPSYPTQSDQFRGVTTSSLRLVLGGVADGAGVVEFKAYGGLDDTSAAATYHGDGWQALDRPADRPQVPRLPPSVPFSEAFNHSVHRSRNTGDSATFEFTGNGVRLHTSVGPDQGIAGVRVDGGAPEMVDLYRAEPGRDEVVFERGDLEPGEHTVTVEVTGEQHQDSTGSWVTLDRVTPLSLPAPDEPFEVLPDGRLIYDDGDRCASESPIHYAGAWESGGWAGAHNGTRHYSNVAGASAEMSFTGTAVAVMAQTRPGHGIAAISVDGGEPELVDTYSDPAQEQVMVWEKSGLEPGEHTVRIEVTGDANPAATNNWVAVDAIIVTP